jgi:hypothetical protein
MPDKRRVRFVDSDEAADIGGVVVDDIHLLRGGEAKLLTEDQEKRAREVLPSGALRAESTSKEESN